MSVYLPLKGIRVLEFCWIWAGPFLGQFLADLGAEVIKIEWTKRFDPYRTRGIETLRDQFPAEVWREMSPSFHSLNRNKVGLTVNLKEPEGIELIKKLAGKSDLLIENWTGGTLDTLGLSVDALKAAHPGLAIVSLSAFGPRSPLEGMRSYGLVTSALSGGESLIVDDGELAGSPTFVISDPNAAIYGLFASMAALRQVRASGSGVAVSVSQLEAMCAVLGGGATSAEDSYVHGIYASRDGEHVAISRPPQCEPGVHDFLAWCAELDANEIISRVRSAGGYAEIMLRLQDTPDAEVFSDLEVHLPSSHPVSGPEDLVAAPWRIDGKRAPLRKNAPMLGEGNQYVLGTVLGLSQSDIEGLRGRGIV